MADDCDTYASFAFFSSLPHMGKHKSWLCVLAKILDAPPGNLSLSLYHTGYTPIAMYSLKVRLQSASTIIGCPAASPKFNSRRSSEDSKDGLGSF